MGAADERPGLVALDVEGVLLPELWIAVAERTGIDELRRTTRDERDTSQFIALDDKRQ